MNTCPDNRVRFRTRSKSKAAVKVATLVDVPDNKLDIDSVKGIEQVEELEGAVDEAGVTFRINRVSNTGSGIGVLKCDNVFCQPVFCGLYRI